MLSIGNTILESSYAMKKILKPLGLDYVMIYALKNNCILYWKEYEDLQAYPKYGESCWKFDHHLKKKFLVKVLRYFSILERL